MTQMISEASEKTETTSVCSLSLIKIITQLHLKALEKAKDKAPNFAITNSAVEGDDENSAKFFGQGKHIILAVAKKDAKNPTPKDALVAIKEYVKWFCGPDVEKKLSETSLAPMNDFADQELADVEKKYKAGEKKEESNESIEGIMSFKQFLREADGDAGSSESGASGSSEEAPAEEKKSAEKKSQEDDNADARASGWYVAYNFIVEGAKTNKLEVAKLIKNGVIAAGLNPLKVLGKALGSFGVSSFDWRSGSTGDVKTLGDVAKDIKDTASKLKGAFDAANPFKKLDPDRVMSNYHEQLNKKWPTSSIRAELFDTKTIVNKVKDRISGSDRNRLLKTNYAICTRVTKESPEYKQVNVNVIADLINKAVEEMFDSKIKGIFRKAKSRVSGKDIIIANNYEANKTKPREEGQVNDSVVVVPGMMISEADESKQSPEYLKLYKSIREMMGGKIPNVQFGSYDVVKDFLSKKDLFDETKFSSKDAKYAVLVLKQPTTKVWKKGENPTERKSAKYESFNEDIVKQKFADAVGEDPVKFEKYEKTSNAKGGWDEKIPADCDVYVGQFGKVKEEEKPTSDTSSSASDDDSASSDVVAKVKSELEDVCKINDFEANGGVHGETTIKSLNSTLASEGYSPKVIDTTQYTRCIWAKLPKKDKNESAYVSGMSKTGKSLFSTLFEEVILEKDAPASGLDKNFVEKSIFGTVKSRMKNVNWGKLERFESKDSTMYVLPYKPMSKSAKSDWDCYIVPMVGLKYPDKEKKD